MKELMMIKSYLFCPRCGSYSELYFKHCDTTNKTFLFCDECTSFWMDPPIFLEEINPTVLDENGIGIIVWNKPLPKIGCPYSKIRYATLDEIIAFGWEKYIQNNEHG